MSVESLDELIFTGLKDLPEDEQKKRRAAIQMITKQGMEGAIPFNRSLAMRLKEAELSRDVVDSFGKTLIPYITKNMKAVFSKFKAAGHEVHIISGGFKPCLMPVAEELGVDPHHVFGNEFVYDEEGRVTGFNPDNPLSLSHGKARFLDSMGPKGLRIFVGDGATDLETWEKGCVDTFIGYGEHAVRPKVKENAPYFVTSAKQLETTIRKIIDDALKTQR